MKNTIIVMASVFYCLCAGHSNAQTAAADNKLSQTITFRAIPKGPAVAGVFEGRPPCNDIAKQLRIATPDDCQKLKWTLTFYRDPVSLQPDTYTLSLVGGGDVVKQPDGSSYQRKLLDGKWTIIKGIRSDPAAEVYSLALDQGGYLYLFKGDDNVLFVLDEDKEFWVGNEDFSYTLNRVELVPGNKE